jgi:hypothetical protein
MNLARLALIIGAGVGLIVNEPLRAQAPPPWAPDKQFSTDEVVALQGGRMLAGKAYMDNGKIRTEISMQGMDMVAIIRPDENKMYSVLPAQKMVMERALTPQQIKQISVLAPGADTKIDLVGPDAINGTPCLKYKMASDNKVFYWWINATTKAPVKIASEDGSFNTTFTNYKVGPQDAALFEPPAGYQVIQAPTGPAGGAPGGSAPAPGGQ